MIEMEVFLCSIEPQLSKIEGQLPRQVEVKSFMSKV